MQYVNKTFTLPTTNRRMTQTDYEIAVGIRNPDGSLVTPTVEVAAFTDFFSTWWGLEDGTLLSSTDPQGRMWRNDFGRVSEVTPTVKVARKAPRRKGGASQ